MIPKIGVESILHVIPFLSILLYITILRGYSPKRRSIEVIALVFMVVSSFIPLIYLSYKLWIFDITHSHVFNYTYSGMDKWERVYTVFFTSPISVFTSISIPFYIFMRLLFRGGLYRRGVRDALSGYLLSIAALLLVPIFYPPFKIYDVVVAKDGMGIHPVSYFFDKSVVVVIMAYLIAVLTLSGSSLYLHIWRENIVGMSTYARRVFKISAILTTVLFFYRLYYNNIFAGRERFLNYTTFDIALLGVLVATIMMMEILNIAETRIIGATATTAFLLSYSSLLLILTINPNSIFPLGNELNTGSFLLLLFSSLIFMSLVISSEIFRRSFLPWFSEDLEFLTRAATFILLMVFLFSLIISEFNLSIYSTFSNEELRVSTDFILSTLFYLGIIPMISMIGELVARAKKNINHVIITVFGIYAMLGAGFNYNIWIVKEYLWIYPLISIPIAIYIMFKYRRIPLFRLLIVVVAIHLIISQITFVKEPTITIPKDEPKTVAGITFSDPEYGVYSPEVEGYTQITSNLTQPLYDREYAKFSNGITLELYEFFPYDLRFPVNLITSSIIEYRIYHIGLIIGRSEGVDIYKSEGIGSIYTYPLLAILLIAAILMLDKYRMY